VKLTATRESLIRALAHAGRVASKMTAMQKLGSSPDPVELVATMKPGSRAFSVRGTDQEREVTAWAEADVEEPGSWVAGAAHLRGVVSAMPKGATVSLRVEDTSRGKRLAVRCGDAVHRHVRALPAGDAPSTMLPGGAALTTEPAVYKCAVLGTALEAALRATRNDSSVKGAILERADEGMVRAVGTDGSRLHLALAGCLTLDHAECPPGALLGQDLLQSLVRLCDDDPAGEASLAWLPDSAVLVATTSTLRLTARATVGEFPDYRAVSVFSGEWEPGATLRVERAKLATALKRAAILLGSSVGSRVVRFTVVNDGAGLHVSGRGLDRGEGESTIDLEDDSNADPATTADVYGMNPDFLLDALDVVGGEVVELWLSPTPLGPYLVRNGKNEPEGWETERALAVVMPVKLD